MKIRKGSLSELTLLVLEKAIDGYVRYDDLIHHSGSYAYGDRWDKSLKKSALSQAIRRLKEKGLIEYEEHKLEQIIITLTTLGRDALGDLVALGKDWDGKYRIVLFDIPEEKRVVRALFRRRLREWDFSRWQKSVWVGKHNVTDKLRSLISKLEIQDWVAVVETDDPSLESLFDRSAH